MLIQVFLETDEYPSDALHASELRNGIGSCIIPECKKTGQLVLDHLKRVAGFSHGWIIVGGKGQYLADAEIDPLLAGSYLSDALGLGAEDHKIKQRNTRVTCKRFLQNSPRC